MLLVSLKDLTIIFFEVQLVIYAVGLIPSKFFEVLGAKDVNAFPSLASYSLITIVLNAVVSFLKPN